VLRQIEKVTVVHIVEDLRIGGLERIIASIVQGLDKKRYKAAVWCLSEGGEIADELNIQGVEVKVLGMKSYYNPLRIMILARMLREENVTILHAHGYFGSTFGRLAAIAARVPVIISHVHSTYSGYSKRNIIIERLLSKFSDTIICISKAVRDFVIKVEGINEKKVHVIYNGVHAPVVSGKASRHTMGLCDDDIVIITVASLTSHKGHEVLLDAIKSIASKFKTIRLLIVGEGPLEKSLRFYTDKLDLSSRIIFMGQRSDIYELLSLTDIFILPSVEREGLGIALIEAMASGLPVIGSRVGGIPEVIEDNTNGLLFSPGDAGELARAIDILSSDKRLREQLGSNGRTLFEQRFRADSMIERIDLLYNELLRKNTG
jgi:glycosyltransferase involved in cell wall biosynthesis